MSLLLSPPPLPPSLTLFGRSDIRIERVVGSLRSLFPIYRYQALRVTQDPVSTTRRSFRFSRAEARGAHAFKRVPVSARDRQAVAWSRRLDANPEPQSRPGRPYRGRASRGNGTAGGAEAFQEALRVPLPRSPVKTERDLNDSLLVS